jgi:hypothetical protein
MGFSLGWASWLDCPDIVESRLDPARYGDPFGSNVPRQWIMGDRVGRCCSRAVAFGMVVAWSAVELIAAKQPDRGGIQPRIAGNKALNLNADQAIAAELLEELIKRPRTEQVQLFDIAI